MTGCARATRMMRSGIERCHTRSTGWADERRTEIERAIEATGPDATRRLPPAPGHRARASPRRMIERRRASGAWLTLARSVYALASHPFTWLRQVEGGRAERARLGGVPSRGGRAARASTGFRPGASISSAAPDGPGRRAALAVVHRRIALQTLGVRRHHGHAAAPGRSSTWPAQLARRARADVSTTLLLSAHRGRAASRPKRRTAGRPGPSVPGCWALVRRRWSSATGVRPAAAELERALDRAAARSAAAGRRSPRSTSPGGRSAPYRVDAVIPCLASHRRGRRPALAHPRDRLRARSVAGSPGPAPRVRGHPVHLPPARATARLRRRRLLLGHRRELVACADPLDRRAVHAHGRRSGG